MTPGSRASSNNDNNKFTTTNRENRAKRTQRRLRVATSPLVIGPRIISSRGRIALSRGRGWRSGALVRPVVFATVLLTSDERLTSKDGKDKDKRGESSRELHR